MEETVANVRLEVGESCHRDVTPDRSVCKEIKNVSVTAEEITENPECVVLRRSIAVQTVTNEEAVIPRQDAALHPRSNLTVAHSEGGSSMEIDVSSQESAMDVASQESLSAKDHRADALSREEALLAREEALRRREEATLECEEKLRICEEVAASRQKAVLLLEIQIREHQERLNNREAQLVDRESMLEKRETAIKIRELEALGYEVTPRSGESNGCLPTKRAKES